jgi:hypothetical protein
MRNVDDAKNFKLQMNKEKASKSFKLGDEKRERNGILGEENE